MRLIPSLNIKSIPASEEQEHAVGVGDEQWKEHGEAGRRPTKYDGGSHGRTTGQSATAAAGSARSQTARARVSAGQLGPFFPWLRELESAGIEACHQGNPPPGSEDAVVAAGEGYAPMQWSGLPRCVLVLFGSRRRGVKR